MWSVRRVLATVGLWRVWIAHPPAVRPRKSGDPGPRAQAERLDPRLRGGERLVGWLPRRLQRELAFGRKPEHGRTLEQEREADRPRCPEHRERTEDARERYQRGDGADIADEAGLEQQGAACRHWQEERQIDDDRVPPAVAQRLGKVARRQQGRERDDRHRAGKPEREGHER